MKRKHKIGNTVYKLMFDGMTGETYIVQTTYIHVLARRILGIPIHKKIVETINYIPVNLSTITMMFNVLNLKPVEPANEEIPYEKYELITKEMNSKFKKEFNDRLSNPDIPTEISINIKCYDNPKNEVVKGFVKEGWHYFVTEDSNAMRRSHYVYRNGLYAGYLHLFSIDEIGFNNDDAIVSNISSVILPREFMVDVLNMFGYYNIKGEGK